MTVPHPLPEALATLIAERFRVLSEPTRVRILDRLREEGASIGELAGSLDTSQQNVSKHVGVLVGAGMVTREKRGTSVVCRIADPSVFDLCELVCGGVERQVSELRSVLGVGEAGS